MTPQEYNRTHRRAVLPIILAKLRGDFDSMAEATEYALESMSFGELISALTYEVAVILLANYDGDAAEAESQLLRVMHHFAAEE